MTGLLGAASKESFHTQLPISKLHVEGVGKIHCSVKEFCRQKLKMVQLASFIVM